MLLNKPGAQSSVSGLEASAKVKFSIVEFSISTIKNQVSFF